MSLFNKYNNKEEAGTQTLTKYDKVTMLPYVGSWAMYTEPMQKHGMKVFQFE